jgi:hypothetical protein
VDYAHHYIEGAIAYDPRFVERAPSWAKRTEDPWPLKEGWSQAYICLWRQEEHQGCLCRRSRALITSFFQHNEEVENWEQTRGSDERFPYMWGWWHRRRRMVAKGPAPPLGGLKQEEPNLWVGMVRRWGSSQGLILESMVPGYVAYNCPTCSWDEAWGGGPYPYTPTSQRAPWHQPYPSRISLARGDLVLAEAVNPRVLPSQERLEGAPMLRPFLDRENRRGASN